MHCISIYIAILCAAYRKLIGSIETFPTKIVSSIVHLQLTDERAHELWDQQVGGSSETDLIDHKFWLPDIVICFDPEINSSSSVKPEIQKDIFIT